MLSILRKRFFGGKENIAFLSNGSAEKAIQMLVSSGKDLDYVLYDEHGQMEIAKKDGNSWWMKVPVNRSYDFIYGFYAPFKYRGMRIKRGSDVIYQGESLQDDDNFLFLFDQPLPRLSYYDIHFEFQLPRPFNKYDTEPYTCQFARPCFLFSMQNDHSKTWTGMEEEMIKKTIVKRIGLMGNLHIASSFSFPAPALMTEKMFIQAGIDKCTIQFPSNLKCFGVWFSRLIPRLDFLSDGNYLLQDWGGLQDDRGFIWFDHWFVPGLATIKIQWRLEDDLKMDCFFICGPIQEADMDQFKTEQMFIVQKTHSIVFCFKSWGGLCKLYLDD